MTALQRAFAGDLDQLRRLAGLSVAELAKRARQPSSSVGDLLHGGWVRAPSWDRVRALVEACVAALRSGTSTGVVGETHRLEDLGWWRVQHADLVRRLTQDARKPVPGEPAAQTPVPGRVPMRADLFVGRSQELEGLASAAAGSGRVAVVAVHGLGGVGKSTLAARFATLHEDRYSLVWWMTADSRAAIDAGLAELAVAVQPGVVSAPAEQRVEAGLGWLAAHRDWLLILDNVLAPADVDALLSRVRTGTVVITSRRSTGWRGVPTVALDVLAPAEAEQLLARTARLDWPEADLDGAAALCAELGWLPLAVHQAGAYLAQTRITPAAYMTLLSRYPARMFAATAEGGDAQRTVARVWRVTLDRLADTPAAGRMLRQLAWYAPENIPRALLTGASQEPDLLEAPGRLAAYSMITLDADTISVHRLVQAVTRTPDPDDPHRRPEDITHARDTTVANLVGAITGADSGLPADWPVFRAVLPHAQALLGHSDPAADTEAHWTLTSSLGDYLHRQGDPTPAVELFARAAHSSERLHGPDHPCTLNSRVNLAVGYASVGALGRAIPLLEATLADYERMGEHAQEATLIARNNLADTYRAQGDPGRAIPLFEAALADSEEVLGPDHPHTLTTRINLAGAYRSAGDVERAIPLLESAVAERSRVLGADHPDTLGSRNILAGAYRSAGDVERATTMYEATLADAVRVLGTDHPRTLTLQNNLAVAYRSAGDLARAIPLYEATLAARQRVMNPDHLDTLVLRANLANAYQLVGDLARAIPMYASTFADAQRVLGSDHPVTGTLRSYVDAFPSDHDQADGGVP